MPCEIESISKTKIVCLTPKSEDEDKMSQSPMKKNYSPYDALKGKIVRDRGTLENRCSAPAIKACEI